VPVRRSTFQAPSADYARYNVEVDLARIGAFGFGRGRPSEAELLLADLQCNADGHVRHRLGSGRSGYHAGRYLKGIGRTSLAANWSGRDHYHASGHLLASAAAREALISTVLQAAGGEHAINACEAVLVRELAEPDIGWLAPLRGPRGVSAADLRLQAITIKDGRFARLSNFLWALDHFEVVSTWLSEYLLAMRRALSAPHDAPRPEDITPRDIAEAFAAALDRGLRHFAIYRRLGIDWGSYHNNFTADGRFLDLEVPLVFGQPVIGWIRPADADPRNGKWVGVDAVSYVRQVRDFVATYRARLRSLPVHLFGTTARELLRELAVELDAVFGPEHLAFDPAWLCHELVDTACAELALGATARRDLAVIVEDMVQPCGRLSAEAWQRLDMRTVPRSFPSAEGGPGWVLSVPASLLERVDLSFPRAAAFEHAVMECDEAATIDGYFDALSRGKALLAATFIA
jgi:hypothetical protein